MRIEELSNKSEQEVTDKNQKKKKSLFLIILKMLAIILTSHRE